MRRLTRGRADTDDEATPQASAASEPVSATPDAQQGGASVPANGVATPAGDEPKTAVLTEGGDAKPADAPTATETAITKPATDAERDLPAGVDPAKLATAPTTARRGRLRRRLRYLRAAREILLRDIGGFYYEAHRSETGLDPHRRLLDAKTARLTRLDEEVRELESRLDEAHPQATLRHAGLGGSCPQCGELHGSDARFCPRCGTPLTGRGSRTRLATTSAPSAVGATSSDESKATTASLWGRPKRPEPPGPADATQADAPGADARGADAPGADEAKPATPKGKADAAKAKADAGGDAANSRPSAPPPPAPPSVPPPAARKPDEPAPTGSERS